MLLSVIAFCFERIPSSCPNVYALEDESGSLQSKPKRIFFWVKLCLAWGRSASCWGVSPFWLRTVVVSRWIPYPFSMLRCIIPNTQLSGRLLQREQAKGTSSRQQCAQGATVLRCSCIPCGMLAYPPCPSSCFPPLDSECSYFSHVSLILIQTPRNACVANRVLVTEGMFRIPVSLLLSMGFIVFAAVASSSCMLTSSSVERSSMLHRWFTDSFPRFLTINLMSTLEHVVYIVTRISKSEENVWGCRPRKFTKEP